MARTVLFMLLIFIISKVSYAQQKMIGECTITYSITAPDTTNGVNLISLKASSKIVFIKGNDCRTDLVSPSFSQSIFYDKTTGKATILREFGSNKFMTHLDHEKWKIANKEFENLRIETTMEHKNILGYDCKKAKIHLVDGHIYTLYFCAAYIPSVTEFEYQFKDIQGLVLAYEASGTNGGLVTYTASKVNLSPVSSTTFILPTKGYRIL